MQFFTTERDCKYFFPDGTGRDSKDIFSRPDGTDVPWDRFCLSQREVYVYYTMYVSSSSSRSAALDHWIKTVVVPEDQTQTNTRTNRTDIEIHLENDIPMINDTSTAKSHQITLRTRLK